MVFAGTPTTVTPGGTSLITTAPALTTLAAPMEIPWMIHAPVPICAPASTRTPPERTARGRNVRMRAHHAIGITMAPVLTMALDPLCFQAGAPRPP